MLYRWEYKICRVYDGTHDNNSVARSQKEMQELLDKGYKPVHMYVYAYSQLMFLTKRIWFWADLINRYKYL